MQVGDKNRQQQPTGEDKLKRVTQRHLPPGTNIQIKLVAATSTTAAAGRGPLPGRPVLVRRLRWPETKFPTSRKLSADESAAANCDPLTYQKKSSVESSKKKKIKYRLVDDFVSHSSRRKSFGDGSTRTSAGVVSQLFFLANYTHTDAFQLYIKRRLIKQTEKNNA